MAKLIIKKASTDVTLYLFIQASNVTTGAGLTGLTFETASLVASYVRPLAARQAITLATLAAVDTAHSDGGFIEVDATNMPGVYRLDLPDAVCATGVNSAVVMLKGAANMAPVLLEIQLASVDVNDAVRAGMTALPNAAADAAGGLPISDAGGLDMDAIKTAADNIYADMAAAADVADAVWDEAIAGHTTAGSFSKAVTDILADTGTDGVALSAAGVDAILDEVVVGTYTMRQLLTVMSAALAGKLSGGGTTTLTFRGINDASDVIVATVDASGNRSALTITV